MSKSNNNHCTPDLVGEQKGDSSPFFHTPSQEDLLALLLKERKDISFFSEEDLALASTFFHNDTRNVFLQRTAEALDRRKALDTEIRASILELAEELGVLARIISEPSAKDFSLSRACAALVERAEEQAGHIRTNIIFNLNNKTVIIGEDSTFFQIKKEIALWEITQKAQASLPPDWEKTRRELLSFPPKEQMHLLSEAIEAYRALELCLASDLLLAAKAAKAANAERYTNILHKTATYLYDTATLLKSIERKEV